MKLLFLVGGYDLEMAEIIKILEQNNQDYIDKHLTWGAKLSDYQEEIQLHKDRTIVGIELIKDITPPAHYIEIDHHNQKINELSSIEQIANMLNIKLTRYQQLIAVNDKSHIKGLIKFGATKDEIEEIRRKDREYQGVTELDEELAEQSIKDHLKIKKGVVVVSSLTQRFSPIADKLYKFDRVIIHTKDEINYYGLKAKELGEKYSKVYGENIVYFGGTEDGFFGFEKGALDEEQIEKIIQEVVEYVGD
ncbi:hypothetical protein [Defluviitalea raffinosedens]|uniref:Uncharacterized protein n=1 Tax=Defluviitalea raffinosedens TaxID=1450156 RepID=A0A7C8LBY8_9FIRM|nr:hypothetical protein [Defluviitalea raffinosedens]KAE9633442.1 hypothetical protein GND95_09395 [Defluviitalea raffinosedens]MBM7687177.1 hypothetical protein [Defluviitalea raffinosedens]